MNMTLDYIAYTTAAFKDADPDETWDVLLSEYFGGPEDAAYCVADVAFLDINTHLHPKQAVVMLKFGQEFAHIWLDLDRKNGLTLHVPEQL